MAGLDGLGWQCREARVRWLCEFAKRIFEIGIGLTARVAAAAMPTQLQGRQRPALVPRRNWNHSLVGRYPVARSCGNSNVRLDGTV